MNADVCKTTRDMASIVAELRVANDRKNRFVIAWPQSSDASIRWHGESGADCGCGCGPAR